VFWCFGVFVGFVHGVGEQKLQRQLIIFGSIPKNAMREAHKNTKTQKHPNTKTQKS